MLCALHISGLELRRKVGPLLIWLLCAGGAAWIYADLNTSPTIIGFAHGVEYPVAPLEASRVTTVAVEVGQEIAAGQVLAILDGSEIEREIAIFEARRAEIEAELAAAIQVARRNITDRQRTLSGQRARLAAQLMELRGVALTANSELRAQRIERARLRALVEARLTDRSALAAAENRIALLKGRVSAARQSVSLLEEQLAEAKTYIDTTTEAHVEVEVGPIRRKLDRARAELEGLRSQRDALILRAPADGRVASVELQAGGIADANSPVVTLVGDGGGRVVACITEEQALDVSVGDIATLHPRHVGALPLKGHVVGLGPLVDRLPSRCRPNIGERAWGRDVVILADDAVEFLPGQALDVRLERDSKQGKALAGTPRSEPGSVQPMKVPGSLSARTRIEPSGLVWVPRLARYVMVSDDTGHEGNSEDASWLMTMDTKGRLDRVPMALVGLDSVKDLEGIASGPGQALYIISSQSHSKKGKRPKVREHFIRLSPEGTGFRANGVVPFAELIDGLPEASRQALGINDTSELDIEGLCAHEGGLLIGLKHPLSEEGHAMIWRLDRPDRLFDSGRLDDAGLEPWAKVALSVQVEGGPVPGGVSELLALPDGALLIATTAATGSPKTQDGGLWWAGGAREGGLNAVEIRTFEGLKPEGLALSPTPGRLVVTFDRGAEPPLWTELPWPSP